MTPPADAPHPSTRPPSPSRHLLRALLLLGGLALLLLLLVNGVLVYVRTPAGTARLLRLGLEAANDAIAGRVEAEGATIQGSHVVVRRATLLDSEGVQVAFVERVEADVVWTSLLRGHIEARNLRLVRPSLSVVVDEDGSNLDRTFAPRHPGPSDAEGKPAPLTFIVQHLDVEEGSVLVQTPESPPFLLQALTLGGAGRYALRSQDFQLDARGNGALDTPTPGPVTLALRGASRGSAFEAEVDIRAAGASVVADVRRNSTQPLDGHLALDVPPALARALVRGWPLRVPLALSAETESVGSGVRINAKAAAGRARLELRAELDVAHASARTFRLQVQHLHLAELLGYGPETDLALSLEGSWSGSRWAEASGNLELKVPPSHVRGAVVGPVEAAVRVRAGRVDVSSVRAVLPGVELTGAGRGTARSLEGTLHLEVADLGALGRTLGDLLGPLPPLAGQGSLHVQLSGRPSHPGLEAEGRFASLKAGPVSAQGLELAFRLPDVGRPLDANATFTAALLSVSARTLQDVHAVLHAEGRAVELAVTSGAVKLQLAGTADGDGRGLLLDTLVLGFPEESWTLKAPAAVRFDDKRVETERLELVSGRQSVAFTGGVTGRHLDAALEVVHLELGHLPAVVAPPALRLAGNLSLKASLYGPERHPDIALQADVEGGAWHGLTDVSAQLEGRRAKERVLLSGRLLALGSEVEVDVDAPELALQQRIHQPLSLRLKAQGVDVARVLCDVAAAGFFPAGCPAGTAVLQAHAALEASAEGFSDGPAVHISLTAKDATAHGLPPAQATLTVDGDGAKEVTLHLGGSALGGTFEAKASFQATTGALLARRPSWAGWRTLPVQASLQASRLNLVALQEARLSTRDMQGTLDISAEVNGRLGAPTGHADVVAHALVLAPWPPGEAHLTLNAAEKLDAQLTLSSSAGENGRASLSVGAPLAEVLGNASPEALAHAALSLRGDLGPFEFRDLPLEGNRLRRNRRLLDGNFRLAFEAHGTLLAPAGTATVTASGLGPKDGAHLEGTAHLQSVDKKHTLDVKLQSETGGTLELEGALELDVSLPALRRGLHPSEAPLEARLHLVRFEPDLVASVVPSLRTISGKLQIDGQASGTLGRPELKGSLSWTDGAVGIIGYGLYQGIQLKAEASNERFSIDELTARVLGGTLSLKLAGERTTQGFQVSGALQTDDFPVVFDDQLWCIATLKADLSGSARPWALDLKRVTLTQADVKLPEAKRKNLQDLSAPTDVILTRRGVPLDARKALRAALDERRQGRAGGDENEPQAIFLRLGLEAPNHVAVRSKDINLELGLSKPFEVELGDATRIVGTVRVLRGRGDVWGRRFDVQPGGQLRFDGAPEQALLDVRGVYTSVQSQAKVYMHLSGELTDVRITPSSDPPMSESEIYTLLATGRTHLAQSSLGSSTAVAGADTGASIVGSWAATELKKAVGGAVPIDVLSVEVGTDERGYNQTRLEAGKYLNDDIYIGYQARTNADPFRYQNANAIRVEYRFLRRWSLQLEYGDANAGSLDAVWSRDY